MTAPRLATAPRAARFAGAVLLALLALPVLSLFVATGPMGLLEGLRNPLVPPALLLSLETTAVSLLVIVALGTPLAWSIARGSGRGRRWVETAIELPVVIPPAVVGVALLAAFGRTGLFGPTLADAGLSLPFTAAAVVVAQVVVAAPFYVQSATAAFRAVDEDLLIVARTLGATPAWAFLRVAVPVALPGLINGAGLAWARALGEFGATLLFAGNLPGRTQTLPLAIYTAMESDLQAARALSVVLVVLALALLVILRGPVARRLGGRAEA